jgi:hypothetical protein
MRSLFAINPLSMRVATGAPAPINNRVRRVQQSQTAHGTDNAAIHVRPVQQCRMAYADVQRLRFPRAYRFQRRRLARVARPDRRAPRVTHACPVH